VAAQIDRNLARLRDLSVEQIDADVALQLNYVPRSKDAAERAACVRDVAIRLVPMHGWHAEVTADYARLRLTGGSVPIELALSAAIHDYIVG
jgi:hypothetical protein